jgi:predicted unusual protein kinase regulating ubiquinone biosynthesis (AarF/ABC1/UbiB family)
MSRGEPLSSAFHRFVKLGGLMGRVGSSVALSRALELVLNDSARESHRRDNLIRNARRFVETLGEMKGAAMKVGQMLSLHEGLLPPEVAEILRALQKEAPKVPPEVMRYEVEISLGGKIDELFDEFDEEADAAASIGQVHRARIGDGRPVAVKVQYPLIDRIVRADLDNLRRLLGALFRLVSDVDFEPVWREVRDRLLEELDYTHEAANLRRMSELWRDDTRIVIPELIEDRSSARVLTMQYLEGMAPGDACSDRFPQELKDRWGQTLLELVLRGLLEHRFLHADPNLANFAFHEDGRVVVYDFGCVKQVPESLAAGYARLFLAALEGRFDDVPRVLLEMGVYKEGPTPLPDDLTRPYLQLFAEILRDGRPYTFGEDRELYDKLMKLGFANWSRAVDVRFPEDAIFIDRAMAGHFGNLTRLRATGPWRALVQRYATAALA